MTIPGAFVCALCGARAAHAGPCADDGTPLAYTEDPLLGTDVGRYRLTGVLGQGGMGRVYAAIQPDLGSRVAIKVINEEYARDRDLAERFFAEARAVNFIRHENIVNVLDLVTLPDGRPVIVMELIEGKTLRELIHLGTTPLGSVVHVMIEVLAALAAAHAAGIIHRDLKPDNILVTASGRTKVLDFGIAKLARPMAGTVPHTRTGAVLGTPEYMAPEQISGAQVDARTDVYAAGVVVFEALTGRRPFEGVSDFELMREHLDVPPPSARSLRAEIPAELEAVIGTALAKAPQDRFATATAMATALHAASSALPASEWRAFGPGTRAFERPLAPPPEPAMHASLVGLVPETSRSLPTVYARPRRDSVPTVHATPRMRATSLPSRRPSWLVPIVGAIGAATLAVVIAFAVRGGPRSPSQTSTGSGSGSGLAVVVVDGSRGFRVRIRFDPQRFDPVAFYPEALALARRLMPDAQLAIFDVALVLRSGHVDLTTAKPEANRYAFRSPSGAEAMVENKLPGERYCYVTVMFTPRHVEVFSNPTPECTLPLIPAPRCSLRELVARTSLRPGDRVTFAGDSKGRPAWFINEKDRYDDCR